MSADNGIYILITKGNKLFKEYRVIHTQAIDNIYYPENKINLRTLYQYFNESKVFYTEEKALREANKLYDEIMNDIYPIIEYGICKLPHLDVTFPEKCPPCCSDAQPVCVDGTTQCYNCGDYLD